jgi:hypothetical protein
MRADLVLLLLCCVGVWHCRYELAYIESTHGVARGQRVWQLAFGSGFKFNSAVLQANRRIRDSHAAWDNFEAEVGLSSLLLGAAASLLETA